MASELYINTARSYLNALEILVDQPNRNTLPAIGMIASHAVELALKAYLLTKGYDEKDIKALRHDLEEVWNAASANGLNVENADVPYAVTLLSSCHNAPYLFRYPAKGKAPFIQGHESLTKNVRSIVEAVETALKAE